MTPGALLIASVTASLGPAADGDDGAHVIPAFARKYGVSCAVCHNPAPRLNSVGESFAANGFRFSPDEPMGDTIATGDELLTLLRRIDLAFRGRQRGQVGVVVGGRRPALSAVLRAAASSAL